MPDYHTDGAIILGRVGIGIEVRRLKYACGEAYLVGCGVVICVDSLRSHVPTVAVDRFPPLGQIVFLLIDNGTLDIVPVALARVYDKSRIVAPFVRISDLYSKCVELLQSLGLCSVAHPCQPLDMHTESLAQIADKFKHFCL